MAELDRYIHRYARRWDWRKVRIKVGTGFTVAFVVWGTAGIATCTTAACVADHSDRATSSLIGSSDDGPTVLSEWTAGSAIAVSGTGGPTGSATGDFGFIGTATGLVRPGGVD